MGKSNRQPGQPPSNRYPGRNQPGRKQMPERSRGQQTRLWILSLCGAVPGAIVVSLTQSFWTGAAVFLGVVIVLGFILYQYEKRKQQ
ncbi:hypothetical protein FOE78_06330 [Microlunatus elymi]|uniref:Uncharacterized protein n=1 Tax=Microlunatus elymi TaxID=2596828 RepID=A0A516PWL3_9ACTN|nr:hypothetical protein [Microlunatus elymi]QDP95574.1 hypothetical protein FOE78_06330 [Microlunatus elymi]